MNRQRTELSVLEGRPKTPEQRRQAIEAELQALPELEAPATVWAEIAERVDARSRRPRRLLQRACAAGGVAAAAAALAVVFFLPDGNPGLTDGVAGPAAPRVAHSKPPAVPSGELVGELMNRSRLAETRRRFLPVFEAAPLAEAAESIAQGTWPQGTEARRLLAARIAAVDASLNRLTTAGLADPSVQERLWRERAELMGTLMRAEQVQREDYFRRAVY